MTPFVLQSSRIQRFLLLFAHAAVVLLLLYSSLPFALTMAGLLLSVGSYYLAERARMRQLQYQSLLVSPAGFCLVNVKAIETPCFLRGEILSTPFLIILECETANPESGRRAQKIPLVLFYDALSPEDWRRLRVVLRTLPGAC